LVRTDAQALQSAHISSPFSSATLRFLAASNSFWLWPEQSNTDATRIWGVLKFRDRSGEVTVHSVKIHDNANPAPDAHRHPYVRKFPMEEYNKHRK
jgi:hypothetical protein